MRMLILSAMTFFGTMLAAGLLALAEPSAAPIAASHHGASRAAAAVLLAGAGGKTEAPARGVR